jgi:succinyl-CoA synthetase beta subunit
MNLNMKLIQNSREENNMINIMNIVRKFGLNNKYSEKFMNIIYKMIEIYENKSWDFIELFIEINKIF